MLLSLTPSLISYSPVSSHSSSLEVPLLYFPDSDLTACILLSYVLRYLPKDAILTVHGDSVINLPFFN